ncbi:MAG: 50S ribosomal protein L11 methyltransferase [Azospirillaceae bacterium]
MSASAPPGAPDPSTEAGRAALIRGWTAVERAPLVPEIALHLATEVTPLWEATEATLARTGLPPPYWAFAWAGGQALARHLLDRPEIAAGRRVLDLAAGGGIAAIAAARAGAAAVTASEIDAFALTALRLNATLNGVRVETVAADLTAPDAPIVPADLLLAGDVCYEKPMADRVLAFLRARAAAGATVLIADPGRAYLPASGLEPLAAFDVPVPTDIEDRPVRRTTVYRLLA